MTATITAPAAGFVLVQADYNLTGTGCPCEGWFILRDNVSGQLASNYKVLDKPAVGNYNSGSMGWVFPVTAGVRSFSLRGFRFAGTTATVDGPTLQAMYVPFGSTGGGTLGPAFASAGTSDTATK